MPLEVFNTEALARLDGGRLRVGLDQALKRATADCEDRPGLKKPRRITLEIEITPVMEGGGTLDSVVLDFSIKERVPARSSKAYSMRAGHDGALLYNELAPEDVDQGTIPIGSVGDAKKKEEVNAR